MTTENSAETCRNPFCVIRKCRFRHDADSENHIDDDSEKIGCSFIMRTDGVGILKVLGSIDETTSDVTNTLTHHSEQIKGLLVVVCSSGGIEKFINPMRDAVLEVSAKGIPTVCWIDRACSGAFEVAISCKKVLCNPEGGEAGGLGISSFYCFQGRHPALVVSSWTPHKKPSIELGPESISRMAYNQAALIIMQNEIDSDAEKILRFVGKQRRIPPLNILEGRISSGEVLSAEELLREGLVDEICSMDEAKTELLMQVWFGDKQIKDKGDENESTKSTIQEN